MLKLPMLRSVTADDQVVGDAYLTPMHASVVHPQTSEQVQFPDATDSSTVVVLFQGIADCNLQAINAPGQQCTAITP